MCNPYNSSTLALYHSRETKMLEKCANNIHLMLIKNEQKHINNLYISSKSQKCKKKLRQTALISSEQQFVHRMLLKTQTAIIFDLNVDHNLDRT